MSVARRVLDAAAQPILIGSVELPIRASIGVALTDQAPDITGAMIQHRADMAMYAAKRDGRHDVHLWSPALQDEAADQDTLEGEMEAATAAGQLRVLYQPIVTLTTGEIVAAEALLRWEHPTRGLLYPDTFIPVAERTGAIEQMGLWVLNQAAVQISQWQRDFARPLYVSVNLSPLQLRQPDLVARVEHTLTAARLNPRDLVLELTESALVTENSGIAVLETLRRSGIRIAIDDFGTGYSSLRYLTSLPVDILKLDRSFVNELNGGPKGSAVAEAVIRLAQALALALDTIAEGIETYSQETELTLLGYRTGQGHHYARAMTATEMTQALRSSPVREAPRLRSR
jgi:EAL domain-containing protein (putative c-di-GMP-specific phosphodiesterase class I)